MNDRELNRRDFHRLSMAAFGGALAGSVAGCGEQAPAPAPKAGPAAKGEKPTVGPTPAGPEKGAPAAGEKEYDLEVAAVGVEKHLCRGLNACKGQGADGANDCAGQGSCATIEHHTCSGKNDCKGQGGCGATAAQNDCKAKGGCQVPLMDAPWKQARKIFEAKMNKQAKEFGQAPAKES